MIVIIPSYSSCVGQQAVPCINMSLTHIFSNLIYLKIRNDIHYYASFNLNLGDKAFNRSQLKVKKYNDIYWPTIPNYL